MKKITHISVRREEDGGPEDRPRAVYVERPDDALEAEPFASGRHRIQRTPGAGPRPASTLWSWIKGDR